jgi:predicted ribosome quality control (RQC) complex YloA/Tae2 family protein
VYYNLSDKGIKNHIIETGHEPDKRQEVNFELEDLTQEQREALLFLMDNQAGTSLSLRVNLSRHYIGVEDNRQSDDMDMWLKTAEKKYSTIFSSEQALNEVLNVARAKQNLIPMAEANIKKYLAEEEAKAAKIKRLQDQAYEVMRQAHEIKDDETALRRLLFDDTPKEVNDTIIELDRSKTSMINHFLKVYLRPFDDQRKIEREAKEAKEQADWIKAYGSDRLKIAHDRGHRVDRIYTIERAAREYPGRS